MPATPGFTLSGFEPVTPEHIDPKLAPSPTGEVRHGTRGGPPDVRLLGGYFVFDSPDTALLVTLLPALVHVRGVERLAVLVRLLGEESRERKSGRDLVMRCSRPQSGSADISHPRGDGGGSASGCAPACRRVACPCRLRQGGPACVRRDAATFPRWPWSMQASRPRSIARRRSQGRSGCREPKLRFELESVPARCFVGPQARPL